VHKLTSKLRKRAGTDAPSELEASVNEVVGWFLARENAFEDLRLNAPQLHETLSAAISRRATRLRLSGPSPDGSAHEVLRAELDELTAELLLSVPNFALSSAHQLALGTLADWLMRCPLDFPPYGNPR
jgi:hypothetical protein